VPASPDESAGGASSNLTMDETGRARTLSMEMQEEAPARAGRREWIGLAVIALPCLLYAMDLTVLHLAVPRLSADLRPSRVQLLWIIDIYGFMVAGWLITMGTLGDRIGRRRLLLFGGGAFGVASVLAAFSSSPGMLIAARAILGVAGATLAPSTLSLIFNMFADQRQRTLAIGVWAASFSAGAAIGPLLGGVLLEFFWWGSVFLLAVPVMVLLLALGPVLLPEYRDPEAGRLDIRSAVISLTAVLGVIYGLKAIALDGLGWLPVAAIAAGIALGVVFLRRQRRLEDPMIDIRLFRVRAFSASLVTYMLGILVAFGTFVFIAQYLQLVLGLTPLEAGLWTLPSALGFVGGSMLGPVLARRFRPAYVMAGGIGLSSIGLGMVTLVTAGSGLALIVVGGFVMDLGLALMIPLATDLIVGTAPPERAGAASGISETGAEFGGAVGIAIMGTIGIAVYRSGLFDAVLPGVPSGALEAARDTLPEALRVASRLPEGASEALIDAARLSFTQGLRLTAAIGAVLSLALVAFVLSTLRDARLEGREQHEGESATVEEREAERVEEHT
jgi:DHA2 family multidrug resistance protein-like MFS transporter